MKTLVVGSNGSMGRRYMAILRHLKEEVIGADIGDLWWEWEFDRVIIATPTDRHIDDLELAIHKGKPILCEKPICKDAEDVEALALSAARHGVDVRMVSNWKYAINAALLRAKGNRGQVGVQGEMAITYNYYDSGKDGFWWDCIQLLYLAGRFKYDRTSPVFEAEVDGCPIFLEDIHESYLAMVSEWLHGDKGNLWNLGDALKANRKVDVATRLDAGQMTGDLYFTGDAR